LIGIGGEQQFFDVCGDYLSFDVVIIMKIYLSLLLFVIAANVACHAFAPLAAFTTSVYSTRRRATLGRQHALRMTDKAHEVVRDYRNGMSQISRNNSTDEFVGDRANGEVRCGEVVLFVRCKLHIKYHPHTFSSLILITHTI
jgi:hypothetical protein